MSLIPKTTYVNLTGEDLESTPIDADIAPSVINADIVIEETVTETAPDPVFVTAEDHDIVVNGGALSRRGDFLEGIYYNLEDGSADIADVSEVTEKSLQKVISESVKITEHATGDINEIVIIYRENNVGKTSEILSLVTKKTQDETATISETVAVDLTALWIAKSFNDTVTTSENFKESTHDIANDQAITETGNLVETVGKTIGKLFTESKLLSDIAVKVTNKVLSDNTTITDFFVMDNMSASISKVVAEQVNSVETITGYLQDYFLSDFVEPGYVGTIYSL